MPRRARLAALLAPAAAVLLLAGCGSPTTKSPSSSTGKSKSNNLTSSFSFASAVLPSYTADYAITGPAKGTMTWTVSQAGSHTIVAVHQDYAGNVESDRIVLTRQGLRFVSAQEDVAGQGHHLTISAHVQGKKILESANLDGKAESVSYPFGKETLVNVAILPTLAGLTVKPGDLQIVQDVILKHGVAVPIGFTANDRTKVTTPAGTFATTPITLSGSGPNQKAFVDMQNHVLVRYVNAQSTFNLVRLTR